MSEINEERLLADENEAECFGISSTELVEDSKFTNVTLNYIQLN